MKNIIEKYIENLNELIKNIDSEKISYVANIIKERRDNGGTIYIIGNGGSAANAMHIANDFTYGIGKINKKYLNVECLCANTSVLTCLANDINYENIFSHQVNVKCRPGDLLICLSGSGNSKNIINAINTAKNNNIYTISVLGYDGGQAIKISDYSLHLPVNDMQIAEDYQLIVFHIISRLLTYD